MEFESVNHKNDIKYIVNVILRNWFLLAICVVLSVSIGVFYLMVASKTYMVSSKIIIDVKDRRSMNASEYFDVSELMTQNKSLQNELISLKSTLLIREAIDEMNLTTTYYMQEARVPIPSELMFTLTNLHDQSPFIVVMNENHPQPINTLIYIEIRDDQTFVISSFNDYASTYDFKNEVVVSGGADIRFSGIYKYGENVVNENCSFKILLNSNYNPEQYLNKQLFFMFTPKHNLVQQFKNNLEVSISERESSMIDLAFYWSNPRIAREFLSNLISKYIALDLQEKNRLANSTIEYIDQQLSNISGSLGQSERQLQNFRSSYDVMNIDEKTRDLSEQIDKLQDERDEIAATLRSLNRINEYYNMNKEASVFVAPSLLGVDDEALVTLIQEMARLSSERQDLLLRNQTKSLRLKTLEQNLENIEKVIEENMELLINNTNADIADIDLQLKNLNEEYSLLPQAQRRLTGLEREFNITDAAYTVLLNKKIEAQIARSANQPDCKIVEPVEYRGIVAPNSMSTIALAIVLGLLFPLIYILARVYLTDKIENIEEFGRINSLKSVGVIPQYTGKQNNVVINEAHTPVTEAFHSVKSNLVYYLFGKKNKVVLVTSSIPNEGKSFSSLNLAGSFANTHNKTILVNLDMRKGNIVFADLLTEKNSGISSYLINLADLDDIIHTTAIPNLDFIDKGEIPPDPVALISSPRMMELFEELKKRYDYIIVDSPPYDVFTDAFLLMHFADIKLFISRIGVVTRKAFRNCINDFNMKSIENIFSMINDAKHIKDSKYSYYRQRGEAKKSRLRFFKKRKLKSKKSV